MSLGKSNQRKKIAGQGRGALKSGPLPQTLRQSTDRRERAVPGPAPELARRHDFTFRQTKEFLHVASCSGYFQGQSSDVGW